MSLKTVWKNGMKDEEDPEEQFGGVNVKTLMIPHPEHLLSDTDYAFTYSPADAYDCTAPFEPAHQKDFIKTHQTNFDNCFACDISVSTEFSVKGRFHFHGILRVHAGKEAQFYLKDVRRLCAYGNIMMKPLKDVDKWDDYCKKNRKLMEQINWPKIDIVNRSQEKKLKQEMKARSAVKKDNTSCSEEAQASTRGDEGDELSEISSDPEEFELDLEHLCNDCLINIIKDLEFGIKLEEYKLY